MITDDRWRLMLFSDTGEGQMFELGEDPDEQNDLYNEPQYAAKQNELLCRLSAITTRPSRIAYYRNMPVHEGRKLFFDRETSDGSLPFMMAYGPPVQDLPFAPSLLLGDHS